MATIIPSRPPPPDLNHILEDLLKATCRDPLFSLLKSTISPSSRSQNSFEYDNVGKGKGKHFMDRGEKSSWDGGLISSNQDEMSVNGSEGVYTRAKSFVERNRNLNEMMLTLQEKNDSLQISNLELKGLADDIRQQAIDALQ